MTYPHNPHAVLRLAKLRNKEAGAKRWADLRREAVKQRIADAIELCERDNKTEAEAMRDAWLQRRGFPTQEPDQGQLQLKDSNANQNHA